MSERESEFARKVVHYLDQGAETLRPGTAYRLKQARAAALAGLGAAAAEGEVVLAHGGAASGWFGGRPAAVRWLGVAVVVAALGLGIQQWHAVEQVREFEDLDLHLLASDLPIDAYLDRGFQNWLRTAFER